MLSFVRSTPRGAFRVSPDEIKPIRLVEQLARAWPKHRLLVITRSVEEAYSICADLQRRFKRVGLVTSEIPSDRTRILVGAADGIGRFGARLEKTSIVLLLDATILSRDQPYQNLLEYSAARIYGLLRIGDELKPHEEDRIAHLLGFEQMTLWRHGQIEQPVVVRTVTNRHGRGSCGGTCRSPA